MMRFVVDDLDAVEIEELAAGSREHLHIVSVVLTGSGVLPCRQPRATLGSDSVSRC
jgi:hypothetical protein